MAKETFPLDKCFLTLGDIVWNKKEASSKVELFLNSLLICSSSMLDLFVGTCELC